MALKVKSLIYLLGAYSAIECYIYEKNYIYTQGYNFYLRQYSVYTMYAHLIHCCTCQFQSCFKLVDFDIHGYTCILTLQKY